MLSQFGPQAKPSSHYCENVSHTCCLLSFHFRTALDFAKHFKQAEAVDLLTSSMWVCDWKTWTYFDVMLVNRWWEAAIVSSCCILIDLLIICGMLKVPVLLCPVQKFSLDPAAAQTTFGLSFKWVLFIQVCLQPEGLPCLVHVWNI